MSTTVALDNRTPFSARTFMVLDGEGQEVTLVVLKATFTNAGGGPMRIADEQVPVAIQDEARGDPAHSSLRAEVDVALHKPAVDVLVEAHAHAPKGQPVEAVEVELGVADLRKRLVVHGDRVWSHGHPSRGRPFRTMPLVYERAFGGRTERDQDLRNAVGIGFQGARSADPAVVSEIANIEYPGAPIRARHDDYPVAGFGLLGRSWQPRIAWAGTYDGRWFDERWPLRPLDYDPRHDQAAPVDQRSATLVGGERGYTLNLSPAGLWRFEVPRLVVPIHVLRRDASFRARPRIDTLWLEPARERLVLTCRLAIPTQRRGPRLEAVVIGHLSEAILRAHATRRAYIDPRGRGGTLRKPLYEVAR